MVENHVSEIKFGTDGWRAVISDKFTFKNVAIVSQAISEWINKYLKKKEGVKRVAIGFDTRFLSEEYAKIVACVLAANRIEAILSNASIPTPALSFGVTRNHCVAGIMITASHNPGKFNGIKIKTGLGGAASREVTNIVEGYLEKTEVKKLDFQQAVDDRLIVIHDFREDYVRFLRNYLDLKRIRPSKYKVITDVMHGSGGTLIKDILKGTNIRCSYMREDVNPTFDGAKPEPVEEYVGDLLKKIKKEKFDLGLILDGDADRIAAVTADGEYVSPQKILGLLILHLVRNRNRKGGIVKTICGTTMLDNIAAKLNRKLYETPVGFKYISDLMISEFILIGGEEAGGIGLQNYIPERDGSLAGLLLLEMMVYQKKSLKKLIKDMEKEFGRYYYERLDLEISKKAFNQDKIKKVKKILNKKVVEIKDFDGIKLICEDESWLMFRPSGTEPLVRVYSEATSSTKAKKLIKFGEALLKKR
ncbi:MAG: phosphoglucomutase/phosphomannomutase family protein [Candidatus Omnitrophota bacterium]